VEPIPGAEVRTGPVYEVERGEARARLAATAEQRRVRLGADLVLVFETRESVRMALEELLRAERAGEGDRVEAETAAFAELLGGEHDLAATLYVDVADPVALAERLGELIGIEGAMYLDVAGRRTAARSDAGEAGCGAFHLIFALDADQRSSLGDGAAVSVGADHPACRLQATLSADQVLAIGTDLRT
jgi:hypothetical protein